MALRRAPPADTALTVSGYVIPHERIEISPRFQATVKWIGVKKGDLVTNGQVVVRPMMYIALTYDHRIVDGSEAVRFLVKLKQLVEDPGIALLPPRRGGDQVPEPAPSVRSASRAPAIHWRSASSGTISATEASGAQ